MAATAATRLLLSPCTKIPGLTLKNHMVMASMTRSRADAQGVLPPFAVDYYRERASAGLILAEGTQPSPSGQGYSRTPGIRSPAEQAAWRAVVSAVHERGAAIFLQLMHVGRVAHPLNRQPGAGPIVAPSAVKMQGQLWTDQSQMQEVPEPEALTRAQIQDVVREYAEATALAMQVGFDGVELHCASGYLPHQFLSSNANLRTDEYGGSPENRARFVVEALKAMIDSARRPDRVGIKINPQSTFNDIREDQPAALYGALVEALNPLPLAYLQVKLPTDLLPALRQQYRGVVMVGGGLTAATGEEMLRTGAADLVAYGASFLANPDLPQRFLHQAPLNQPVPSSFYTPGPAGYTDYPILYP